MILKNTHNLCLYKNKDNRIRVYIKNTKKVMSYSKYLMQKYLGRLLSDGEQVHHCDKDFTNNKISNLELTLLSKHLKEYHFGKIEIHTCIICGTTFICTSIQRSRKTLTCSKRCRGISSHLKIEPQLRNLLWDAAKVGEPLPMGTPSEVLKKTCRDLTAATPMLIKVMGEGKVQTTIRESNVVRKSPAARITGSNPVGGTKE